VGACGRKDDDVRLVCVAPACRGVKRRHDARVQCISSAVSYFSDSLAQVKIYIYIYIYIQHDYSPYADPALELSRPLCVEKIMKKENHVRFGFCGSILLISAFTIF
jgi:hypothetical protein